MSVHVANSLYTIIILTLLHMISIFNLAILSIDDDSIITKDSLKLAMKTWKV